MLKWITIYTASVIHFCCIFSKLSSLVEEMNDQFVFKFNPVQTELHHRYYIFI